MNIIVHYPKNNEIFEDKLVQFHTVLIQKAIEELSIKREDKEKILQEVIEKLESSLQEKLECKLQ